VYVSSPRIGGTPIPSEYLISIYFIFYYSVILVFPARAPSIHGQNDHVETHVPPPCLTPTTRAKCECGAVSEEVRFWGRECCLGDNPFFIFIVSGERTAKWKRRTSSSKTTQTTTQQVQQHDDDDIWDDDDQRKKKYLNQVTTLKEFSQLTLFSTPATQLPPIEKRRHLSPSLHPPMNEIRRHHSPLPLSFNPCGRLRSRYGVTCLSPYL
jgi:hypothetical protein